MNVRQWLTQERTALWDRGAVLTLLLLAVGLLCVAWSLAGAVRGLDLVLLGEMALVGVVCGWLMARTRLHGVVALALAVVLALGIVFLRVTGLAADLLALMPALGASLWNAQYGRFDPQAVAPLNPLGEAVVTLATRLVGWGGE